MVLKKRTGMKGYGFTVLAILINPFFPNAYFLYTLKAWWENHRIFWCFQGVEKGCIEKEYVKTLKCIVLEEHSWR